MNTADIIQTNKEKILKNWLESIRKAMPILKGYKKSAIENSVPDLLDAIIANLETQEQEKVIEHSRVHGTVRTHFKEYSLKHIVREYNFLKSEIFHYIDDHGVISPDDRDTIMEVIDAAIEQATEIFHRIKQGVHVNARQIAERRATELELEDENRENFIQSITHDLNNPLNNIKACISLLEGELNVGEINEILRILKTSASQADSLIKDFLDVGKISTVNKLPVVKGSVNIIEDLNNELQVYKVSEGKNIKFIHSEKPLYVSIDIDLVRRAFNNLMNNALKHRHADSEITINCQIVADKLDISIQNYGKIIPANVIESIFDRYYQIDGSPKGWGIGLAFVKEVAKAHDGEVTAISNENDGTIFKFILPAH